MSERIRKLRWGEVSLRKIAQLSRPTVLYLYLPISLPLKSGRTRSGDIIHDHVNKLN